MRFKDSNFVLISVGVDTVKVFVTPDRGDMARYRELKEFSLLETLMRRPGEALSRFQLLEHSWDYHYERRSNVVDVYTRYLREKIDRPFGIESIETVRGVGYRLREDGGS